MDENLNSNEKCSIEFTRNFFKPIDESKAKYDPNSVEWYLSYSMDGDKYQCLSWGDCCDDAGHHSMDGSFVAIWLKRNGKLYHSPIWIIYNCLDYPINMRLEEIIAEMEG